MGGGAGVKASHDSESSLPGIKTLSFFQSVVVAVKETLQPDSHSSLHLKSCLCTLKEQLQARECGRPLVVGVLQRADRIREGLPHKEHQERVNICSGTTHDPEGFGSLLHRETPGGCRLAVLRSPRMEQEKLGGKQAAGTAAACYHRPRPRQTSGTTAARWRLSWAEGRRHILVPKRIVIWSCKIHFSWNTG